MAFKKFKSKLNKIGYIEIIFIVLASLFIVYNLFSPVFLTKSKYFLFEYWQNFDSLKKVYLNSQYVNKNPQGWIPDETVNSYAGGEYIKGENPVLIAADTPPLGRYIIGLSVIIFNNENILTLVFASISLLMMFAIGKQIFSSNALAIIPPALFSFEPIFKNQIIYSPLLDIFQLFFLLASFFYFNKGLLSKKSTLMFATSNIFLGLFISTKFFITGITIVAAWFIVLLIRRQKEKIKTLIFTLPISIIILLFSYIRLFAFDYSIRSFLGVQKYVFLYHKSQLILPLTIWPLLLFNKWFVWFGDKPIISDPQWLFTWPILTIISIITLILYATKKITISPSLEVLLAWVVFYIGFFSFGQISSRYFVILIPILYIISLYGIVSLYKVYRK